jgi:hypothetical protein
MVRGLWIHILSGVHCIAGVAFVDFRLLGVSFFVL